MAAKNQSKTSLFDFLKDIMVEKKNILTNDNQHVYSKYMICRFLSMSEEFLPIVDGILNRQQEKLSNQEFHKLCIAMIPQKDIFLRYVKSSPKMKEVEQDLEYIIKYFNVSKNEAYDYYQLSGEELVKNIKKLYGIIE